MAKTTRMFGPFRYHILDNAPFTETRMSLLWLAEALDTQKHFLGEKVVLKVARLKEELFSLANQRAIENEVRWLRQLDHPGIIKLRPIAEEGTVRPGLQIYQARSSLPGEPWFVVTDYLPGGTLLSLIEERKKLSVSLALQIAHSLADALTYVHAQGCVHRDFKPQNVLFAHKPEVNQLTPQTRPILIDFGIANHRGDQQLVAGTKPWLAPECEQAMKSGTRLPASPTMDMYALGLTLYFMVTGRRPPDATPGLAAQLVIQPDELVDVGAKQRPTIAAALNQIVHKTIDDDPGQRLTAAQMAAEMQQLLLQIGKHPSLQLPERWAWVGGVTVAALLGLVIIYNNVRGPETPSAQGNDQPGIVVVATATATPALVTATATSAAAVSEADMPTPDIQATIDAEVAATVAAALANATETAIVSNPTATASLLNVPTSTQTTASATIVLQPTNAPTATPPSVPIDTPTPVPTQTPLATSTPHPTNTPTPAPTATATAAPTATRPATPVPVPVPVNNNGTVTLLEPLQGVLSGRQTFRWEATAGLGENQAFEMIIWAVGQDPANGFGPFGIATTTSITGDLDVFARDTGTRYLVRGREYQWGVRLVQREPYTPIRYLGGGHRFLYGEEASGGSGGNNDGGGNDNPPPKPQEPTDTPTPRG